jgi:hypothetical protein
MLFENIVKPEDEFDFYYLMRSKKKRIKNIINIFFKNNDVKINKPWALFGSFLRGMIVNSLLTEVM